MITIYNKQALANYVSILFGMLQEYPQAMTPDQVQRALNMGEKQVYKKIHTGELPAFWIGNGYRILKSEVVLYIAMNSLDLAKLENNEIEKEKENCMHIRSMIRCWQRGGRLENIWKK